MSNDSKLITVYIPKDKAEHLVIEALLDSAGIEAFSLNLGVQNLFEGGGIGGFNVFAGVVEIQVAEGNVAKAIKLINSKPQLTNPL